VWLPALLEIFSHAVIDHLVLESGTTGMTDLRLLVHSQVTIIFVVSVGLSVCLFVCAEFFSAVFDPISIKLGHVMSGSSCVP